MTDKTASDLADRFEAWGATSDRLVMANTKRNVAADLGEFCLAHLPEILSTLRRVEPSSDQPRPSVFEDQGSSRDHALTDSVALDGEHFGPWRVWFDPPPIGTRECDWHYQHEDAEPECPAWMHGHCASRDACIAEIIDGYEERA